MNTFKILLVDSADRPHANIFISFIHFLFRVRRKVHFSRSTEYMWMCADQNHSEIFVCALFMKKKKTCETVVWVIVVLISLGFWTHKVDARINDTLSCTTQIETSRRAIAEWQQQQQQRKMPYVFKCRKFVLYANEGGIYPASSRIMQIYFTRTQTRARNTPRQQPARAQLAKIQSIIIVNSALSAKPWMWAERLLQGLRISGAYLEQRNGRRRAERENPFDVQDWKIFHILLSFQSLPLEIQIYRNKCERNNSSANFGEAPLAKSNYGMRLEAVARTLRPVRLKHLESERISLVLIAALVRSNSPDTAESRIRNIDAVFVLVNEPANDSTQMKQ